MRVLITGEMATLGSVARVLDAAHNKRRIAIVLHLSDTAAARAAEAWANTNGVLFATIEDANSSEAIFQLADSVIAFPGSGAGALDEARAQGVKVWEPYKPKQGEA